MSDDSRIPSWLAILTGGLTGLFFPHIGASIIGIVIATCWCLLRHWKETAPARQQRYQESRERRKEAQANRTRLAQERAAAPRLEAEERRRTEACRQANAKRTSDDRRRKDARVGVEIFFNLHAPELGNRFDRAMLDEFVTRYMGDDQIPEVVEARAMQLTEVMRQHLTKVPPAEEHRPLEGILAAYAARKQKIQNSDLDPRDKETLLIQLDEHRERDLANALRDGRV